MKKTVKLLALSILLLASCAGGDPIAESGRTKRTEDLLEFLKTVSARDKFLFGHHDDTVYGVGWVGEEAQSDVKNVCGDYPALIGFDLGGLETGQDRNLDGVEFDRIRQEIIRHFQRGGVITLSWHCDNPLSGGQAWVADSLRTLEGQTVKSILEEGEIQDKFVSWLDGIAAFLGSLETPEGIKVPVIFRPWHEHTGSWFWWGQNHCSPEEFQALWRLTVDRFREKGGEQHPHALLPGKGAWQSRGHHRNGL